MVSSMPLLDLHVLLLIFVGSPMILGANTDTQKCTQVMDLAFVVDSSGSICNDKGGPCDAWRSCLSFIQGIVNDMVIGENGVRVALITFSNMAIIRWNLSTYSDKSALLDAIKNKVPFGNGNTNTPAALNALSTVFSAQNGDRAGVRNTAILITDGKPEFDRVSYPLNVIRESVQKVIAQQIRLLVVGVTDSIDMDTLKELSSPPNTVNNTVFFANDYQSLQKVLNSVEYQTCKD